MAMEKSNKLVLLLLIIALCCGACEKLAWRKARKENTVESFREYLDKYPYGENVGEAKSRIESISFREINLGAKKLEDYKRFVKEFPDSDLTIRAKNQIMFLTDKKVRGLSLEQIAAARATVETSIGDFTIRLFPDKAPEHCRNFLALALSDFYNGIKVSRVEPGRMVKMGDPRGDGLGGPGHMLKAEINDLSHKRGIVSMWHLPDDLNTAGSQFFICLDEIAEIDGQYTIFGEVVEGLELLDRMSKVESTGPDGRPRFSPRTPIYMKRVKVEGIELK